jgi:hypothetical protein
VPHDLPRLIISSPTVDLYLFSTIWKEVTRGKDVEDALVRLDKVTHGESRMVMAENFQVTHNVGDKVGQVIDGAQNVSIR